jgi:hypothetical protein
MPSRTCRQHQDPSIDCITCLGDELVRLRHLLAVSIWKQGGTMTITDQDIVKMPARFSVRETVNEKRQAVVQVFASIVRPRDI